MTREKAAEVIIIGAGIIGTSIAYHLAKFGCRDVIVLEKEDTVGAGSTVVATGGVRHQFFTEVNIKLSIESLKFFEGFEDEIGSPINFQRQGYMYLLSTEEEMERARQAVALQQKLGVNTYLISPEEAKKRCPLLNTESLLGATYGPSDGKVDTYWVVQGFASAAKRLGARIYTGIEVVGIKTTDGHQVKGVLTNKGEIEAPAVVNAAGAYAGKLGKTVGLDIPLHIYSKQGFFTAPSEKVPDDIPNLNADCHTGFSIMTAGRRVLHLTLNNPDEPEGFDTTIDWNQIPAIYEVGVPRFPFLAEVGITTANAGLHHDTPDMSAILGGVPEIGGLYLACGLSNQGIMHSPVVGRVMAEYILGIGSDPAISLLRLSRFKDGALQKEGWVFKSGTKSEES